MSTGSNSFNVCQVKSKDISWTMEYVKKLIRCLTKFIIGSLVECKQEEEPIYLTNVRCNVDLDYVIRLKNRMGDPHCSSCTRLRYIGQFY